jgi:hypothetical protein
MNYLVLRKVGRLSMRSKNKKPIITIGFFLLS